MPLATNSLLFTTGRKSGVPARPPNCSGARRPSLHCIAPPKFFVWILCAVACPLLCPAQLTARSGTGATRAATDFPGRSIVEQIQAAIRDCGPSPCEVFIPAGTYNSSPISTWKNNPRDGNGANVGIALPSNVDLRGAGRGHTIINVTRAAGDPPAILFANANPSNRNLRLRDLSITWTDSDRKYDWVTIFLCHGCEQLELDHLSLEGNPNKLVNLLDCTGSNVHDNIFSLHTTGYGHGDNALSVNRFDPAARVGVAAGVVRDNQFIHNGDRVSSMLIVTQSGLDVHSNVFEAHLPPPGNATAIETGQDNLGRLAENVKIANNMFYGSSIAYGGLSNSDISDNFLDHGDIYIALQSGTTASLSGLTIAGNELHFGSINVSGTERAFTGRCVVTRNRVYDGNIRTGNSLVDHDLEVSYNLVRYSANMSGIDCNACSLIRGNIVREIGQNAPRDVHPGYLIGGTVLDVSDNLYIDEQHEYDSGTICSVASPSSSTCLSSANPRLKSRWILLHDGEWAFGWCNRTLATDRGNLLIHAFVSSSLLELDDDAPALPAGTRYHLFHTTFNAFELNSAVIERFANNMAIAPGGFRHAAVQEDGTVHIHSISGNVFRPYSCSGPCAVDYRSTVSTTE